MEVRLAVLKYIFRPINIIGFIVAALLCLFVYKLVTDDWFSTLSFSNAISPLEVVNFLVTSLIAIWLGVYITKKLTEQRFIKEFVISDIYNIEKYIADFELLASTANQINASEAFNKLNTLRHKIDILQNTATIAKLSNKDIDKLTDLHRQLYCLTTDSDGEIVDIGNRKDEVCRLCGNFIISLRHIICYINKVS